MAHRQKISASCCLGSAWRSRLAFCFSVLVCLALGQVVSVTRADESPKLTFFAWSDQHVQTNGDGKHLEPAIDAMNQLPGTAFPTQVGGHVGKPAFVFGCGDITQWPTNAAKSTYEKLITSRLKFPAYDVIGNHDEGGNAPSETIKRWLISRHGALSYSFESGGVRFIALYSKYDESLNSPAQPLTTESLAELRNLLQKAPKEQPTVVATHLCFDALTNKDALLDVLKPYNILAILGGHYHKAKVDHYRSRVFVQVPSPAPGSASEFLVVRITPKRIVAVPYDYQKRVWSMQAGKVLDAALEVPVAAGADVPEKLDAGVDRQSTR